MNFLKTKTGILLILALAFFFLAVTMNRFLVHHSHNEIYEEVQKTLQKKERDLDELMKNTLEKYKKTKTADLYTKGLLHKKGYVLLVYEHDSLKFWSSNRPPVPDQYSDSSFSNSFLKLGSGWYEILKLREGAITIKGLILIYSDYKYENDFLVNGFQKDFSNCCNAFMDKRESKFPVYGKEKQFLFSLGFQNGSSLNQAESYVLTILYLVFFMLFLALIFRAYHSVGYLKNKPWLLFTVYFLDVFLIRALLFYFKIPATVYSTTLFSPEIYAISCLIPSLGDLLVNVFIVSYLGYLFFINARQLVTKKQTIKVPAYLKSMIASFIICALYFGMIYFIRSLISDSTISLTLNNIFSLNEYSVIALFIIATLILTFALFSTGIFEILFHESVNMKEFIIVFFLVFALSFALLWNTQYNKLLYFILLVFYVLSYLVLKRKYSASITAGRIIFNIFIFAVLATYILNTNNTEKEKDKRKTIIISVAEERDPIAEYLFSDIEEKSRKDNRLKMLINRNSNNDVDIISYLQKKYFNGFWKKYRIQLTLCRGGQKLLVNPYYMSVECDDYFREKIQKAAVTNTSSSFFFLNYGYTSYIGILPFTGNTGKINIYAELDMKSFSGDLGYPELLIDRTMDVNPDIGNYSSAKYERGVLVKKTGKFEYSADYDFGGFRGEMKFIDRDGYNHLLYSPQKGTLLVLSQKKNDILTDVSPFSYMLIFFSFYVLFFVGIMKFPFRLKRPEISYSIRLQITVISIVVFSFLGIGTATVIYIFSINKNKNIDILSEKTRSLQIELKNKLGEEQAMSPAVSMMGGLQNTLVKFSNIFFTDINLYGLDGKLLASSRPEIFEEELISGRMNANAYNQLINYKKLLFIQDENIGKQKYLSAYAPFENDYGETVAYLNLPYFAKQSVIRKEISGFLMAYTNFYLLIIALIVIITFIVSNYITQPLQLISKSISRIKLGKKNEKITWSKKDEIGNLIHEYNRMIDELEKSAVLLAQSERESAWREMAKQVAHEIKNPLTPMKLSIQHLMKAWEEKVPDREERFKKITRTLIEQIDSLSAIATEFSDFAKMPSSKKEKIELNHLIYTLADMYQELDKIHFKLPEKGKEFFVFADKKQMMRVFNNLMSNSVEALENNPKGEICVQIAKESKYWLLQWADNGQGISESQKKFIFTPDFTTKTGGTGLGLAMVRNIIIDTGGEIWFESKTGQGTTFFIRLPLFRAE